MNAAVVDDFLKRAEQRMRDHPSRIPFELKLGLAVISWLRIRNAGEAEGEQRWLDSSAPGA